MLDELYPLIKKTSHHSASSCRIIFISSNTEFWANLRWPLGVEPTFNSWKDVNDPRRSENARYAQSKVSTGPVVLSFRYIHLYAHRSLPKRSWRGS